MRWYLDTEFNEDGKTIELISIALVSEYGHEYYAHSADYDVGACNEWVRRNVLPFVASVPPIPRSQIAADILRLVIHAEAGPEGNPEFWAYFADYDWVALCQLYGPMVDLPSRFPKYCRDLKQLMDELGVKRSDLAENPGAHDALVDARWARDSHQRLLGFRGGLP